MKFNTLILLGGKSSRFNSDTNKVYCLINNKPIFLYSLDKFLTFKEISKFIIVYNENDIEYLNKYIKSYDKYNIELVKGGSERYLSVINGLKHCEKDCDKVIVHDGARPNISIDVIRNCIEDAKSYDSVSVGVPVTDTIKEIKDNKFNTIDRNNLYIMQTPQITSYKLLVDVLNKVKPIDNITDDLMAIEKYSNVIPHITIGNKNNIKLTTIEDLELIKYLLGDKNA